MTGCDSKFVDLVIQTNHGWFDNKDAPLPPKERFRLADDLYIEKPDDPVANMVLDFGEPTGFGVQRPYRQYAYFYAFVREIPETDSVHQWDTDGRLQMAVALSRLIRPTSISFRYAARIRFNDDGTVKHAFPAWLRGVDPDSCVVLPSKLDSQGLRI
jgi:hypothetical protein